MGLAVMRDISLLWLVFLTLVAIIPFGVLFYFAIKGVVRLRQLAKEYLPIATLKAQEVAIKTDEITRKVVRPVVNAKATTAQAQGITRAIFVRRK